jgi:hypothetical protein
LHFSHLRDIHRLADPADDMGAQRSVIASLFAVAA